jgi:hypothetical protein
MILTIDTSVALSEPDRFMLQALLATAAAEHIGAQAHIAFTQPAAVEPEPAPAEPKKATRSKKATPKPDGEAAGNGSTDAPPEAPASSPSLQDAVDLASRLIADGDSGKVREALAAVGATRVSGLDDETVPAFLAALSAA